jgi:hypothetical protein
MIRAWDVKKAKTVIKRWGSFEVNSDSEDDMPHGEAYTFLPVVSKIFCRRGVPVSRVGLLDQKRAFTQNSAYNMFHNNWPPRCKSVLAGVKEAWL